MSLTQLLTTYFAQLTLILGGIGGLIFYFIKRKYDLKSKKIEIRHSIFQQNKLDAIKNYFVAYTECENAISKISTPRLVLAEYTAAELDEITKKPINDLCSSNLYLSLFLEKENIFSFNSVTNDVVNIHLFFVDTYFNKPKDLTLTQICNRLERDFEKVKVNNRKLLNEIGDTIKELYDS